MKKLYPDAAAALEGLLRDGMLIAAGGFGLCGVPERLLEQGVDLRRQGDAPGHLGRVEQRPARLDLAAYPHLPRPSVRMTAAGDYTVLVPEAAA